MKLLNWLNANIQKLEQAGISTARLDCLVLLEDALVQNRGWLLAHPEHRLDKNIITTLDEQISRRSRHEPLAYIREKSEFYGREFIVNRHTLQPRPETETMIELLQELVESYKLKGKSRKLQVEGIITNNQQPTTNQRLHGSNAVQGEAEQHTKDKKAPALNKQLQHLDEVQGASEQQTESYMQYDEGAATGDWILEARGNDPAIAGRLHGSDAVQGEAEQWTESYQAYGEGAAEAPTQQRAERAVSTSSLADWQDSSAMTIVDVGTGSGCIAVTAKLLYPEAHVIGTDIDSTCLSAARQNATKHNADINLLEGNLLKPLTNLITGLTYAETESDFSLSSGVSRINHMVHEQRRGKSGSGPQTNNKIASSAGKQVGGGTLILLANLPYVPDNHTINHAAMHEPRHAIFGGDDGLDYYRSLFKQLQSLDIKPRLIFTEAMPPQHDALESIAQLHNYQLAKTQDFIQVFSPAKTAANKNT